MTDCEYLELNGWHQWYNPNYWVHPDLVTDPSRMDYTYYGMGTEEAVQHERDGRNKIVNGVHNLMEISACNPKNYSQA